MKLSPDVLLERFILRQKLKRWKIIAFVLAIMFIGAISFSNEVKVGNKNVIARVSIDGIITSDFFRTKRIKQLVNDKKVKAVIFSINSPGGSVFGGEQLYNAISYVTKSKPTVTVVKDMAASGGYMSAVATDYIICAHTSLVGSIGAIFQYFNVTNLMEQKMGIKPHSFKSSKLKATPSPFERLDEEVKTVTKEHIDDIYIFFRNIVKKHRQMSEDEISNVANGNIFIGYKAVNLKLVDAIGGEQDAINWLRQEKKISPKLEVVDYSIIKEQNFIDSIMPKQLFKNMFYDLLQGKVMLLAGS